MDHRTASILYGPPSVDPGVPSFMAKFSASMILGQKTPKKRPGTGTPKRLTQGDTVEVGIFGSSGCLL